MGREQMKVLLINGSPRRHFPPKIKRGELSPINRERKYRSHLFFLPK